MTPAARHLDLLRGRPGQEEFHTPFCTCFPQTRPLCPPVSGPSVPLPPSVPATSSQTLRRCIQAAHPKHSSVSHLPVTCRLCAPFARTATSFQRGCLDVCRGAVHCLSGARPWLSSADRTPAGILTFAPVPCCFHLIGGPVISPRTAGRPDLSQRRRSSSASPCCPVLHSAPIGLDHFLFFFLF